MSYITYYHVWPLLCARGFANTHGITIRTSFRGWRRRSRSDGVGGAVPFRVPERDSEEEERGGRDRGREQHVLR